MRKFLLLTGSLLLSLSMPGASGQAKPSLPFPAKSLVAPVQIPEVQCQQQLCFRSTFFFVMNFKRLRFFPRDILISSVNFHHPVEVTNANAILTALRNPATSPIAEFNRQYVTTQLSLALFPLFMDISASRSSLSCYGLDFPPVTLSTGATITPASPLSALFSQCDVVAILPVSDERDEDMMKLAQLLALLNSTCV